MKLEIIECNTPTNNSIYEVDLRGYGIFHGVSKKGVKFETHCTEISLQCNLPVQIGPNYATIFRFTAY